MGISRIKLKLHFVQNVEPDAGIGQKGAFFKGLILSSNSFIAKPKLSHFFWVIDVSAVNDDRFFQKNLYRKHISKIVQVFTLSKIARLPLANVIFGTDQTAFCGMTGINFGTGQFNNSIKKS